MSQPPTDANASELFTLLSAEARPFRIITLPRKKADGSDIKAACVVLTQAEMIIVSANAERATRALLKDNLAKKDEVSGGYMDAYNNRAAIEVLHYALKKPDEPNKSLFARPEELAAVFSNDSIGVLYSQYLTVKQELGPIVTEMSDDDFEMWVQLLIEGGSANPLDFCSLGALTALVMRSVKLLHELRNATSSAGSQQEPPTEQQEVLTV